MSYLNPTGGFLVLGGFAILSIAAALFLTRNSGESTEDLLVARESTAVPIIIVSSIATWLWSMTLMGTGEVHCITRETRYDTVIRGDNQW